MGNDTRMQNSQAQEYHQLHLVKSKNESTQKESGLLSPPV